jgi:hypothetical protein
VYRTTVGVVSGIVDELIVEGQRRAFSNVVGVIAFDDFLRLIVQCSIADEKT